MKTVQIIFLLLLLSFPALAAEAVPVNESGEAAATRVADMRILLNAFTALAEDHIQGTLHGLKILSATGAMQSGDWNAMKATLGEFSTSGIDAAAVWYARPDGHYYTVDKGLIDQTLSDRPYFPRLMAGASVVGDLVISKSTGKRSAILAVPVWKNGTVNGALGVSLSAEKMSRMLQEKLALPADMVFYALDAEGQSSLHSESSRLFSFPSDLGSKSLKDAVQEMLARPEGVVRYEFHGNKVVVFKRSPLTGWVFAIGFLADTPGAAAGSAMPPIVAELEKDLGDKFRMIDADLAAAAKELSASGLKNQTARKILDDLCRSTSSAIDCATVDSAGTMLLIEPAKYRKFEGAAIGSQEQMVRLHATKKPVMSRVIRTVEGLDAVDIEHPVFSPQGTFEGSVSMLITPESLIASVAGKLVQGLPIDVWAMQTDGRILYDPDREEIGRMLFSDTIYKPFPELLALGAEIAKEPNGSGSYTFLGKGLAKPVTKNAYWTSVGLYGTEWRVVATHTLSEDGRQARRELAELGVKSSEEALRELAGQPELIDALAGYDQATVQRFFTRYLTEQYGIYAIQWLDSRGISRYGFPVENSLTNYDLRRRKTPASKALLQAHLERKESSFDAPLVEGEVGHFFLVPVRKGKRYLGMIYIISLRP
ncbi:MAG: hypothetical protein EG822_02245 [Deltaproteobacteria bacterium]|nr:hypothetical protein [Deltaproteobacteria bacterium]TLN04274.1 MAG: hypothetical protein FDZ73_04145 [bacterium]